MPNFLGLYSMAPGTDYAQQTVAVNTIDDETITELMRIVQPIYEDLCVEGDEWLGLTLGVDRAIVVSSLMCDPCMTRLQSSFKTMTVRFITLIP